MRKVSGLISIGLGAFLLVMAGLTYFWAPGVVEKTPKDVDSTTRLDGTAQKLNTATGEVEDLAVKVTSVTKADSEASTDDVVVFVNTVCVVIDEGDVPDCVDAKDPQKRLITASVDTFATDRHTGLAVEDATEYVGEDAVQHQGLVNKFPFGAEKKTYDFWDTVLKEAVPAEFEAVENLDGLTVYRYHMVIDSVDAEIVSGVDGTYSLDKTMWVEPNSGAIVNQAQRDVRLLPDGSTALDMDIAFTEEQVADGVQDGKDDAGSLQLVTETAPLVGLIGGIIFLTLGVVLTRGTGRREH